jgi:hypothetical protein
MPNSYTIWLEIMMEINHLIDPDVNGRMILKCTLREGSMRVWAVFGSGRDQQLGVLYTVTNHWVA